MNGPAPVARGEQVPVAVLADGRRAASDASGSALLRTPAGLARIYLTTHGDLIKSAMVVGTSTSSPLPRGDGIRAELAAPGHGSSPPWSTARAPSPPSGSSGKLVAAVIEAGRQATVTAGAAGPRVRATRSEGRRHGCSRVAAPAGTGEAAGFSPEDVRISMASAIALGCTPVGSAAISASAHQPPADYEEGCRSDCGYGGLARGRPGGHAEKSFIRVAWPLVRTDELVTRLARFEPALTRLCISMVTHGLAYRDTCDITCRVRAWLERRSRSSSCHWRSSGNGWRTSRTPAST